MKRKLTLTGLFTMISFAAMAQPVTNGGFENWTNKFAYRNPSGYVTTNGQSYVATGNPNVTRVTDAKSGQYALKLTTTVVGPDTPFAGLFLGSPSQNGLDGGAPYGQRADSFGFFFKSSYGNDSGMAILIMKKSGTMMGVAFAQFGGKHNTYQRLCVPISYFVPILPPDSVAMIIFSSNPDGPKEDGSWVQVDSMFMTSATTNLPNHSFENWIDVQNEEPDNWITSNAFLEPGAPANVVKSTDKHSGSYSAQVTTAHFGFGGNNGFVTNGYVGGNSDGPAGGMKVNGIPDKISFWYKYTPNGHDSGMAGVWLHRWDNVGDTTAVLEKIIYKVPPASTWTYKELTITYSNFGKPCDTVAIGFAASDLEDNIDSAKVGSKILVDDVTITYKVNSIYSLQNQWLKAWPMPANDRLNLQLTGFDGPAAKVQIIGVNGALIAQFSADVVGGIATLDISSLPGGNYLTVVNAGTKEWRSPLIVVH